MGWLQERRKERDCSYGAVSPSLSPKLRSPVQDLGLVRAAGLLSQALGLDSDLRNSALKCVSFLLVPTVTAST